MGLYSSLAGTVKVELTSADVTGSMGAITDMDIPVSEVRMVGELSVCFSMSRRNLKKVTAFAEKRGDTLRILHHNGMFWSIVQFPKRPILFFGLVTMLMLVLLLPSRVLFIEVEGNDQIPEHMILDAAQAAGVHFGASRRQVRSEEVKNKLIGHLPQLQWAGVNTYGCRAVISVRERAQHAEEPEQFAVSNIVASCDGVITSCTVTGGTGLCEVGQAVEKGQVLISGYTDCGLQVTATRASGVVFAQTQHVFAVVTPAVSDARGEKTETHINYAVRLGKKRINFYKGSGISDGTCVKMYLEYNLTLPGGFQLPVALIKEETMAFKTDEYQVEVTDVEKMLSDFAQSYLCSHMVAGSIMEAQEQTNSGSGIHCMRGTYNCIEMIGREQGEQIGDFHGKTD